MTKFIIHYQSDSLGSFKDSAKLTLGKEYIVLHEIVTFNEVYFKVKDDLCNTVVIKKGGEH